MSVHMVEVDIPEEDIQPDDEPIRPDILPPDIGPSHTGDGIYCEVCDEEIYRAPGTRGRKPRWHPECKPSGSGAKRDSQPRRTGSSSINATRDAIIEYGMFIGTGVAFFDKFDGLAIVAGSEEVADSLIAWSDTNPKLRRALERGGKGIGPWKFVGALGTIIVPIAAHHDYVPKAWAMPFLGKIAMAAEKMKTRAAQATEDIGL